jgi:hypothetical protein
LPLRRDSAWGLRQRQSICAGGGRAYPACLAGTRWCLSCRSWKGFRWDALWLKWRWLACYSWSELLSFPIKAAPSCSQPLISPRVTKSPGNRWSCLHKTCSAKIAESKYLCHFHTAISTVSHPIWKSHRNRGRWMRIRHLALPH